MEESLRRTSELGRELLERARCREVDWWSTCTHDGRSLSTRPGADIPEEERPASLEEAFSALSRFMRETTEQCERYHCHIPAQGMNTSERRHVSRFHCGGHLQPLPVKPAPCLSSPAAPLGRTRDLRDVHIEVAPGTYSISATSPNCQTQTHVVNITPGRSVDLTFDV